MPAIVTPFDSTGELDTAAHQHNVEVLSAAGIGGFVVAGSNGEGPYLEPGERRRLIDATRAVAPDAHVMVGIMAESVRQGIRQIEEAADADSLLIMTPTTLTRGRPQAVSVYFRQLIEASTAPVFLYSVPPSTAYSLEVDLVAQLAGLSGVVGMKDSSGDVVRLQSIVDATPDEFFLYSGSTPALSGALTVGADGVITGSVNYCHSLVLETVEAGDRRSLQKRLTALSRVVDGLGVPGVKAAAALNGLRPGLPRLPLAPLSEPALRSVTEAMDAA